MDVGGGRYVEMCITVTSTHITTTVNNNLFDSSLGSVTSQQGRKMNGW